MARKLRDARLGSRSRRDRSSDGDEAVDRRTLKDQERLDMFRMSLYSSILPNLPKIPGFHVCWLTTTNPADSIVSRIRLGYTLLKARDVPGFENMSAKTGEYQGCVAVNEMVAAKLPLRYFQMYMKEAHHDAPLEEEQKLEDALEAVQDQMRRTAKRGRKLRFEVEEGTEEIVSDRPVPKFRKLHGER